MSRIPAKDKNRITRILSHPERPLKKNCDLQYPGLTSRRRTREAELLNTTAMERVLIFITHLRRAVGLH